MRLAFEQARQPLVLLLWIGLGAACLGHGEWWYALLLLLLRVDFLFLGVVDMFLSLAVGVFLSSCSAGEFARFVSQSFISVLFGSAFLIGSSLDS